MRPKLGLGPGGSHFSVRPGRSHFSVRSGRSHFSILSGRSHLSVRPGHSHFVRSSPAAPVDLNFRSGPVGLTFRSGPVSLTCRPGPVALTFFGPARLLSLVGEARSLSILGPARSLSLFGPVVPAGEPAAAGCDVRVPHRLGVTPSSRRAPLNGSSFQDYTSWMLGFSAGIILSQSSMHSEQFTTAAVSVKVTGRWLGDPFVRLAWTLMRKRAMTSSRSTDHPY